MRYDLSSGRQLTWIFDYQGNVLDEPTLDFAGSTSQTNGERHNTGDYAHSLFDGMQFRNISGAWQSWGSSVCWSQYSTDPDYNNQLLSSTGVQVSKDAPQC